ncbi:rhodopsin, GQ-coupled [Exaiptasia diaphana]|uniref:G-protein coupled receptors family 1 profile domain-containing protein n=1 Tax=Exaiptasia diaphana TaxID=2652724 RepID=A0A913YF19_EXADI|nr:rhodopsin, GQ-coupled [Exaiptasia diaphana]XP_020895925.1 rhodopsin, GQ-coupled [Exaiptasia diaphana]XP_020895926.1 rhodopsin, GQ-coupled [Exaiptasia diaphana]XP_020895927.1 rhodopsin, GQ-coupled [Exaiptasia diaphana]XP_020895928.1 rhodopsin, GQ-coupled [Exaiptasia diaphana]XP_020895929.1 rhodopsin, GQ-coupled [Exaiptasia diaphana]XP_028513590.1 rhodopsin, GQ-coupled [Exaiptasia diaphana]XP_028513591.1 rhodopsin, GQ-coupled [Exaiptasia diaphana]XP_028513592.1 rhodopsin, GQ-coupled [Exaip
MNDFTPQIVIPLSIISFLVVSTNIAVCILVLKIKGMRSYTNGFVVSLAISDILTGITLIIHYNAELQHQSRVAINILYALVLFCGVWNICAVTFDRYLAVVKPFSYRTIIPKFFRVSLPLIWGFSVVTAVLPALAWEGNIKTTANKVYIFFTFFFCAVLPLTIIMYANLRIFLSVRRCVQKERELSISTETPRKELKESRRRCKKVSTEAKVAKVFAIAALMLILSWFPIFIYSGAFVFNKPEFVPKVISDISPFTIALGSLVNPILYSFMKPDFRHALERIVRRRGLGRNGFRSHRCSSFAPSLYSEGTECFSEKNNNQRSSTERQSWTTNYSNISANQNDSCTGNLISLESAV